MYYHVIHNNSSALSLNNVVHIVNGIWRGGGVVVVVVVKTEIMIRIEILAFH